MEAAQIVLKHIKNGTSDRSSRGTYCAIKKRSKENSMDSNAIVAHPAPSATEPHMSVIKGLAILFATSKHLKENSVN